jgi:hypothetical protein
VDEEIVGVALPYILNQKNIFCCCYYVSFSFYTDRIVDFFLFFFLSSSCKSYNARVDFRVCFSDENSIIVVLPVAGLQNMGHYRGLMASALELTRAWRSNFR